ncbi:MAG: efflux transporter outer membrane subunit [Gemmatimonadales bacterium]|nr:efflux transporter outer membrane subunit [Gemmatimonadales bacterium]
MASRALPRGWTVTALIAAVTLTACARGTSGARIEPPAPLGEAGANVEAAANVTDRSASQWWHSFGSAALDSLIEESLRSSPTVAAAEATLRQSEALVAARAEASRLPRVDASLAAQRQRLNPAALGQPGSPREFGLQTASVSVRYRFDLSGGSRRTLEALAARSDHQRFQLAGARLSLAAGVAMAAVQQAQVTAQLEALEAILTGQEEELAISRDRERLGAASPDELLAAEGRVAQTRAEVSAQRALRRQGAHLLSVLAGRAPGVGPEPQFTFEDLALPAAPPTVIPSELVRRRPDIQAAEALMRAADAEHGVAVARLYPQLDLSAALGSQAISTGALFGAGSAVWTLVAQLTQPLFTPGLHAEKRAALAAFEASAAHYQGVVLESLRGTADLLVALEADAEVLRAWTDADLASQAALESARRRYALGAASYRDLLEADQQAHRVRVALAGARAKQMIDVVALHQALGGASEAPPDPTPPGRE